MAQIHGIGYNMSFTPNFDLEKHVYVLGNMEVAATTTPYSPLQKIYFTGATATLDVAPTGTGNTVVKLIRNNDLNDVIYTATFTPGATSVSINTKATLNAGDTMSLNISSVSSGSPGTDLVFKLKYYH